MKTRTSKAIGLAVSAAAIAVSVPLAVNADAEPTTTTPVAEIPDPQGPQCGPFKDAVPTWKTLSDVPVSTALASIPDVSTFSSAVSGQLNPAVNVASVFDNGPYVIFAPSNEAFAALPPDQLAMLTADPAALTRLVYYHAFLGLLGPDDLKGQRPTQEGTEIEVTGSGGDIKVNETSKVLCGGIAAQNARIYIVDEVLDPALAPAPITPTSSSSTSTSTSTPTSSPTAPPAPLPAGAPAAPLPAAEAPIG